MTRPQLLTARGILPRADSFLGSSGIAGLLVVDGCVGGLFDGHAAIKRAAISHGADRIDLGEVLLAPGLVNAHAHLELSAMQGKVAAGQHFFDWVGGVIRERARSSPEEMIEGARQGLRRAAETGTTTVGDIASSEATLAALASSGRSDSYPRVRLFREALDAWDISRTPGAAAVFREPLLESDALFEGYSPHAPYTVSSQLFHLIAEQQRRRPRQLSMHWAEMEEELLWLESGTGPLAQVLGESPRRSGLDLLEEAGLLGPQMALVHGNLPSSGEVERIAEAGATVVHCPGTHRFFERPEFPLEEYLLKGVPLALGTDSLASNDDLDLVREARLLWARYPLLSPERLFEMMTTNAAQALGLDGRVGALRLGAFADYNIWEVVGGWPSPVVARSTLEALLGGGLQLVSEPGQAH
mgnify:CR=1 FL=1